MNKRSDFSHLLAPRRHWNWMRRRDLVIALRARIVKHDEVKAAHKLSDDELAEMDRLYELYGDEGLRRWSYYRAKARARAA